MDSRPKLDPAIIGTVPLSPQNSDVSQTALALAKAYAFRVRDDGALIFENKAALEQAFVFGPLVEPVTQPHWEAGLSGDAVRARRRAYASLNWPGAQMRVDYTLEDGQGGRRHVREIVEAIEAADGSLEKRGVLIDQTETVEAQQKLLWASRHDAITGLENQDALIERGTTLATLATRARMDAQLLRLRVTNLDDLGSVYGVECAERLLGQLARRLEGAIHAPDALARLNETDFGICVLGTDPAALGERLKAEIAEAPYGTPFGPLYLDVELVMMRMSPLPGSVEDALEQTQARLDGHPVAAPGPRRTVDMDVIAALENDRISLAFQPIVSAKTGEIHHHECLLRFRADDGRMISAGAIVQDAERLGLISQLDERALRLAIPHLHQTEDLHLALNVSAGTLGDPQAAGRYLSALKSLGPLAKRITIEMTETLAVDDPAAAARFSAEIRALGCCFAVDDFGSGYTTFRNLMAVEADSLKIDGSLIKGIATDENKQTFMRMMVDLAQTFSVKTVAEMVETEADAAVLRRLGADYLQGYHFGVPSPAPVWSRMAR